MKILKRVFWGIVVIVGIAYWVNILTPPPAPPKIIVLTNNDLPVKWAKHNTHASLAWYNYKTNEFEYLAGQPPKERMKEFIPQYISAQNLFDLYIEMRKTELEALIKVLEAVTDSDE